MISFSPLDSTWNQTLSLWKHSSSSLPFFGVWICMFPFKSEKSKRHQCFFVFCSFIFTSLGDCVTYSNACLCSAVSRPSFFMFFLCCLPLTNHQAFTVPKKTKADRFSQVRTKVLDSPGQLSNMMWIKPSCMLFCLLHLILDSGNIQIQILQHSKEKKNSALISLNLHISGTRGHTCTFVNKLITVNRNN